MFSASLSPAATTASRPSLRRITAGRWPARLARTLCVALLAGLVLAGAPAPAQSPFSAALYVNDQAITHYEIDQRARFLEFIGAGGADPRARARERLIEDALQIQEGRRLGVRATSDEITEGMNEFAARAELSGPELIDLLTEAGIDAETFRSFIHAGVIWRTLVNGRYGGDVQVTDAGVDRARSVEAVRPITQILISEIFLPADEEFAAAVQQIIPQILAITSTEEFANAARQVSAAPSAEQGGRVERWIELGSLPEPVAIEMAEVPVGTVIGPIEVPGAYGFFQLRARRDTRDVPPGEIELEYRRVGLPGGRSEANLARAAALRSETDSCADFGAALARIAPELPAESVATLTRRASALDAGAATELGRLNPGQISANLVESGELVVLMLCARRVAPDPAPTVEEVRLALYNQALEGIAEVYLRTLRAEAEIRSN